MKDLIERLEETSANHFLGEAVAKRFGKVHFGPILGGYFSVQLPREDGDRRRVVLSGIGNSTESNLGFFRVEGQEIAELQDKLASDLAVAASRFEKDVEKIMKKHGATPR